MTIVASLLFITIIAFSFYTISTSLKSSMPRVEEIIQSRNLAYAVTPKIRIGKIKHYKASAKIASAPTNIKPFTLNLTHKMNSEYSALDQAA